MKTNRKFSLGLLALIILCACTRAPQEIQEKALVPAVPLKPEDVSKSIVRIVSMPRIKGIGSGFYVARDKIATNIHLIAGVDPVSTHVSGSGGTRSIRGVTAYDIKNNLVILKVSVEGVPLPLGDSDAVKTGDAISANGFRAGERNRVTQGTVLGVGGNDKWFSTTLDPDPDVSGSPIWNSKGEVMGIEVIAGEFGYAIPSNTVKVLLAESGTVEPFAQWQQRNVIRAYGSVEQAKREFSDENYNTMIEALNAAITLNPEFATAYTNRSEGKLSLGQFESERGKAMEAQQHYHLAIDDCTKALQLNPESAAAYKNRAFAKRLLADAKAALGNLKEVHRDYNAAIADYAQAIKRGPNNAGSYDGRGTARGNLGRFESERGNATKAQQHYNAAIADYTQAIKLKPDYAKPYYSRGLIKKILGQQETAKLDLEKAKTLKREQATVRVGNYSVGFATGFFVARNKIATNVHVISAPGPILVESVGKKKFWTIKGVTAFDVKNDLVILKVAGEGVPLPLGNSDTVSVGEPVVAVGYPGREYKVTEGTIHSVRNSDKWIRVKINTGTGSSGSAILNSEEQVIGVDAVGYPSYSYAIPSNALKALLARSGPVEPLAQWQKRAQISAYHYYSLANLKYGAERYEDAIADLNKAIQLNPELIGAYNGRAAVKILIGEAETQLGNIEKAQHLYQTAIEDLEEAVKLNPESSDTYRTRAAVRIAFGNLEAGKGDPGKVQRLYEMAIQDCTQVIKLEPDGFLAYDSRGVAKFELATLKGDHYITEAQQLYKAAIADYTQAIQMAPAYPHAYNHRGYAKVRLGKSKAAQRDVSGAQGLYTAAIADYTQAIQLDPEYVYAYNNRGWAKYLLGESEAEAGNMERARQLYEAVLIDVDKSIELDSDNADAYRRRGTIKVILGNPQDAIADFDKAIQIDPGNAETYYERGRAKEAFGQKEAAEADFQKAKALAPDVEK